MKYARENLVRANDYILESDSANSAGAGTWTQLQVTLLVKTWTS